MSQSVVRTDEVSELRHLLRVDLSEGTVRTEEVPEDYRDRFVSGKGLGAALLLAVPRFTSVVTAVGAQKTLRSGGVGLLALVGVPVALLVVALTVVGIPLSLAGLVAFALLLWVAFVYGTLVTGTWLLSLVDREGRWLALGVGLVAVTLVGLAPFVGGIVEFLVLLVGLGAFVLAVRGVRSGEEGGFVFGAPRDDSAEESTAA